MGKATCYKHGTIYVSLEEYVWNCKCCLMVCAQNEVFDLNQVRTVRNMLAYGDRGVVFKINSIKSSSKFSRDLDLEPL